MTRSKPVGRFARAWLMYCGRNPDSHSRQDMFAEESVLIDRRPPPPVSRATDTIIGWQLDPRWIE